MSTAYLRQKLAGAATDNGDPVLTIETDSGLIRVYSPEPSEYRVSADVVEKAQNLGADMIAYANTWCGVTLEGEAHGRAIGVDIMPFGEFFQMLRRRGVAVG